MLGGAQGDDAFVRIVVLGAGLAGCAAALVLSRRGHDVTLIDRDDCDSHPMATADQLFDKWQRPAIGQFRQPHNFLGRARSVVREEFPDVYAVLRSMGAVEVDQQWFLGSVPRLPGDERLATIGCRRPVFDAVLRNAVSKQPTVTFRAVEVSGLRVTPGATSPHVSGVTLRSGHSLEADLVVDSTGRHSPVSGWLTAAGIRAWPEQSCNCGLLYYSRHYQLYDHVGALPYASILGGPRGDLGYLAFAVFLGDNGTFCLCVMPPAWDKQWRQLRQPQAFDRVARHLPGMKEWLEPARPITDVLPMGRLRNTLRHTVINDVPVVSGLVPLGDARSHTNPTFAFGASLALSQAVALGSTVDTATDPNDLTISFAEAVGPDATERFLAVSAEDRDRYRAWSGQPIRVTDRHDTMSLFLRSVVYRVATQDPAILRAVCRRINALDPVDALSAQTDLLDRAETIYRDMASGLPAAPPRTDLLDALHAG
ncbi:MAG TPA: FAD-dependent oxidoreductase [Pseudonocardiaceae bacterium]|nr:FAD-dependent oxidoreductase [Pseudonocardiaceae bacterium]